MNTTRWFRVSATAAVMGFSFVLAGLGYNHEGAGIMLGMGLTHLMYGVDLDKGSPS